MRKIINAIRDFIYNITDYGLIIIVVAVMVGILAWRFDLLFSRGINKEVLPQLPVIEEPIAEEPEEPENPVEEEPEKPTGIIARVDIPPGSFPSQIGQILLNNNLIESNDEFLTRCVELNLDTKLQSGTFEIEVGTGLDDIIKIIAKVN